MQAEPLTSGEAPRTRILFVEDESLLRDLIQEELTEAGYDVIAVETGEQALGIIRDRWRDIDILFTDIRLPGSLDGWNLAFEFRYFRPEAPVVYATGFARDEKQVFGSLLLRKPYNIRQVIDAFQTVGRA